jgi:YfiH family protein
VVRYAGHAVRGDLDCHGTSGVRIVSLASNAGGIITENWSVLEFGSERAVDRTLEGVRMLFGFGPPRGSASVERRAHRVLEVLQPALGGVRWGQQVHGRVMASLAAEPGRPLEGAACVGRCDALITAEAGLGVLVWTADCVPVLLAGGGVVAAVHSGWRGCAADIVGVAVRRFASEYGVAPGSLRAALGPAISGPAYPVGREVIDSLARLGLADTGWSDGERVDLRVFLAARLESLGVSRCRIETVGPCTASTPEMASFRRDGAAAGRQWSLVYRTP